MRISVIQKMIRADMLLKGYCYMKRKPAFILAGVLGLSAAALCLSGCGKNEATKAAAESEETEKEGNGEAVEASEEEDEKASEEAPKEEEQHVPKVAIILPGGPEDKRWRTDAEIMQAELEKAGHLSEVFYAEGDADTQVKQILEAAVPELTSAIIIAPQDPYSLSEALQAAADEKIPVFDYEELIMNTPNISYFLTFDARAAGQLMADRIIADNNLSIPESGETPESRTIEYLMGEGSGTNDLFLLNGLLERLQEYYDAGVLTSLSYGSTYNRASVVEDQRLLQEKGFVKVLRDLYGQDGPDIICTRGKTLTKAGASLQSRETGTVMPGTEENESGGYQIAADIDAFVIQQIASGQVHAAVFKDNRKLAQKCAETVINCLKDEDPEVSNYEEYDNGVKIIKAVTCDAEIIDKDNYQVLIDDGFFEEEDIRPQG